MEAAPCIMSCADGQHHIFSNVLTPFGCRYQGKGVRNTVWKTDKCDRAHPPTSTTPFISSTCSGAPCFLLHISCYHAQDPFIWFPYGHSVNYICAWTHILQRVSCRSRTHPPFCCHRGAGPLQFSISPLGIFSTSFSSGVGQRPLLCNCASQFIWLNVASVAILAGLLVTSAINPHTSVNKLITSWGQKSPLVSHRHNVQTALCGFRGRETKRGGVWRWQIV